MSGFGKLYDCELPYDEEAEYKGLVAVWAYRCERCGYIWLPKDYDVSDSSTQNREPPKSCARCKSKYWRQPFMERKSKHAIVRNYDNEFKVKDIVEPTSKTRALALLNKGEYLHVARLRPDFKGVLLKHGLIKKIEI